MLLTCDFQGPNLLAGASHWGCLMTLDAQQLWPDLTLPRRSFRSTSGPCLALLVWGRQGGTLQTVPWAGPTA